MYKKYILAPAVNLDLSSHEEASDKPKLKKIKYKITSVYS